MAYYFNENFDKIATRQGIKIIQDYLIQHKDEVMIEVRHVGTRDEVILIQTCVDKNRNSYSNTVSLTFNRKEVMINPVYIDGENATEKLMEFIKTIPQQLRDTKLERIIDEF